MPADSLRPPHRKLLYYQTCPDFPHLIGLAFQRAAALLRIASALPPDDPRVSVYQRLAAINAQNGFRKIGDAGYLGQHWLATYAVLYMQAANTKSNVPTP